MNLKKTKIIIFSKNKVNKENFYFYYSSNAIEIVDCYKYLGVDFHSSGKFIQAVSSLSDKAKKAYFALKSKLPYSENLSVKTWLQLFNSMITPILTYGSEVWISEFKPNFEALDKSKLEKTQNSIFKNILGVHGKSSNLAVRCELGTLPISIKCYQLMYKYYERLSDIGERSGGPHEIFKAAFEVDKTLTNRENSWSYKLSELMKYIAKNSIVIVISNRN